MSYFIIDNKTEIDFNKIILGNQITINNELSRIYIYYLDEIPKEIFLKIPPIRVIYNFKNLKYNQIKLPIYPLWDETINFLKLIKKIEKHIKIKLNLKDFNFISSLDKNNNIKTLKVNITDEIKIHSKNNYTYNLKDISVNSELEGIFSLSYIWMKNKNNTYGLSLNFYQLKYTPRVDELNIDFFDIVNNNNYFLKKKIDDTSNNTSIVSNIVPPIIKSNFIISKDILSNAILKLNKKND